MKLPPHIPPHEKGGPNYERDRNLIRRTVAGAAGGMKGVDYEDDRRPDPGSAPAAQGAAGASPSDRSVQVQPGAPREQRPGTALEAGVNSVPDEVGPAPVRQKKNRRVAGRDRLSVDKDAPDHDETDEPIYDETTLEIDGDAIDSGSGSPSSSRAHLFASAKPEPGSDLGLTDPAAIQRAHETPLGYAKHVMILAEAFRRSTGASRDEAIEYLCRMFLAPTDRVFGRSALKEFGPSSGILDVYPLEVTERVIDGFPNFLPKVSRGTIFSRAGARAEVKTTDPDEPVILEYPSDLKIRGFALRGGGRPGYTFEPGDLAGEYQLKISTPGRWTCLVSAVTRTGHTTVDVVVVVVRGTPPLEISAYPPRDPARVAAWPVPPLPDGVELPVLISSDAVPRMAASELIHQRALDDERRFKDSELDGVDESDSPIAATSEVAPPSVDAAPPPRAPATPRASVPPPLPRASAPPRAPAPPALPRASVAPPRAPAPIVARPEPAAEPATDSDDDLDATTPLSADEMRKLGLDI